MPPTKQRDELTSLASEWEELAQADPMWAILSDHNKRGRKWREDDFFARGEAEIADLLSRISVARNRALDFGCGIGRLTRALGKQFKEAWGVDISEEMVAEARELNPHCRFIATRDLSCFPDRNFDLIYTVMVLQHLPSTTAIESYILQFVRI